MGPACKTTTSSYRTRHLARSGYGIHIANSFTTLGFCHPPPKPQSGRERMGAPGRFGLAGLFGSRSNA